MGFNFELPILKIVKTRFLGMLCLKAMKQYMKVGVVGPSPWFGLKLWVDDAMKKTESNNYYINFFYY